MMSHSQTRAQRFHYEKGAVDWKGAAKSGCLVGCIFLLATAGNPWGFSALIVPTVMGREIFPGATHHFSFGFAMVHVALATVFSLVMAPILQRVRIAAAIAL